MANQQKSTMTLPDGVRKTVHKVFTLYMGNNNDNTINGGIGMDDINGFGGNDILSGGDGDDSLDGMSGNDTLTGGSGSDTFFVSEGFDVVTDFNNDEFRMRAGRYPWERESQPLEMDDIDVGSLGRRGAGAFSMFYDGSDTYLSYSGDRKASLTKFAGSDPNEIYHSIHDVENLHVLTAGFTIDHSLA